MIELLFPPQWIPTQPYLGMACLAGYLREKGVEVHQTDVNALFYNYILSKRFLEKCKEVVEEKYAAEPGKSKDIAACYVMSDVILDTVERAKRDFKCEKSLNIEEYMKNIKILQGALKLVSEAHSVSLSLFDFKTGDIHSVSEIFKSMQEHETFFPPIYREILSLSKNTFLCGISITGITHIVPGLMLAGHLKEVNPDVKVVLGGSVVTRWENSPGLKAIFDFCDMIVIKEGEEALVRLSAGEMEAVPNVGYLREGRVCINPGEVISPLDELPTPVFENLGSYFSPRPVLPVYASRACYWGRCAFCDHGYGYNREYRQRSPQRVVEDLSELEKTYGARYFTFADEAIPPSYLRVLSDCIRASGLEVRWLANVRAERFTEDVCEKVYGAGGRMLLFGVESGCQRVLDLMDKGTSVYNTKRVLRMCKDAGLWNHAFLFFGFPGEKREDAAETIKFVCENKDIIDSVGCSTFLAGKYARVCMERERFGVRVCNDRDMAIWYDYEVERGITKEEAEKMRDSLQERLYEVYPFQRFLEVISREHLLELIDHECDFSVKRKVLDIDVGCRPRLSETAGVKRVEYDVISVLEGKEKSFQGGYVVCEVQDELFLEVTETGAEILLLCRGEHSAGEIAGYISRKYGVDYGTALKDTIAFLREMSMKNVVELNGRQ